MFLFFYTIYLFTFLLPTIQHLFISPFQIMRFHLTSGFISFLFPPLLTLQESEFNSNKRSDSPSEELPSTPRAISTGQNPKYQLFLSNEVRTNGLSSRDADGPGGSGSFGENGPRLARWETTRPGLNHFRGSLESLASRDWDSMSDRVSEADHGACVWCSMQESWDPTHRSTY